ncbi:MAG: hypothetical protein O2820_16570 [Planctomycetota bacterium]|nr:hypothetical protein [Planctomycetota bacterium]MDA1250834.1 hypothetical protein [Planctomycetota bacterium]
MGILQAGGLVRKSVERQTIVNRTLTIPVEAGMRQTVFRQSR